jgi:hypothetical protein
MDEAVRESLGSLEKFAMRRWQESTFGPHAAIASMIHAGCTTAFEL